MNIPFAELFRTDGENEKRRLWRRLSDGRLADCKFRRHVLLGAYMADFVCFRARLVIEMDGGQCDARGEQDEGRIAWLNVQGFTVLRFASSEVLDATDSVLETIRREVTAHIPGGDSLRAAAGAKEEPTSSRAPGAAGVPAHSAWQRKSGGVLLPFQVTPHSGSLAQEERERESGLPSGEGMRGGSGFALVSALAFLLVITLLGVSLFLGVNEQQKAAGNSLEKTRALELAQSVTMAAERWLATADNPGFENCADDTSVFRVCASVPTSPTNPSQWGGGKTTVSFAKLAIGKSGGINTYYAEPGVWISYLGRATMGPGALYRIDAYAYGGGARDFAVTEAVFYVGGDMHRSTPAQNLGH